MSFYDYFDDSTNNTTEFTNIMKAIEICHQSNYLVAICSGIFGAIGIPGNIFVILLISKKFYQRKCYEWLLFIFAFTNLVLCSNGLFLQTTFILDFDKFGCQVAGFINHFFGIFSFCIPPLISLNQCMVINNSTIVNAMFTKGKVIFVCLLALLLAMMLSLPFLIMGKLGLDETGLCDVQITTSGAEYLVVCGFHTPVVISHIVSGYCTYKVVRKIRHHEKQVGSLFPSSVTNESSQIVKALSLFLIVPLVCQIPGLITKTIQLSVIVNPWISRSMISPFFLASASYAYLTLYSFKEYKSKAENFLFCNRRATNEISDRVFDSKGTLKQYQGMKTVTKVTSL